MFLFKKSLTKTVLCCLKIELALQVLFISVFLFFLPQIICSRNRSILAWKCVLPLHVVTLQPPASLPPSSVRHLVTSQTGSYDGKALLQVGRGDSLESEGESCLNRVNSVSIIFNAKKVLIINFLFNLLLRFRRITISIPTYW